LVDAALKTIEGKGHGAALFTSLFISPVDLGRISTREDPAPSAYISREGYSRMTFFNFLGQISLLRRPRIMISLSLTAAHISAFSLRHRRHHFCVYITFTAAYSHI
jgi:hypothetical protein